jgi:uncharacterized BrkB/YihY/UPF0761 family membrane protein
MKKIFATVSGLALSAVAPVAAFAQSYDYNYNYDYSSGATDVAATGLGIGLMIMWGIAMIVGLAFFILWIMMLVDAFKRQWPERTTWLVILIVGFFLGLSWLAAILYYFLVKRKNVGTMGGGSMPAAK